MRNAKRPGTDRRRHTLYLNNELVEELDRAYRQVAHDLYPVSIAKSDFLEALVHHGLAHLDPIRTVLANDPMRVNASQATQQEER